MYSLSAIYCGKKWQLLVHMSSRTKKRQSLEMYRKSFGVSDWAASRSKMYCIRRWRKWVSDSRVTVARESNSWGRQASHMICWFLAVRTRDLSRPHTYSWSSPAIYTHRWKGIQKCPSHDTEKISWICNHNPGSKSWIQDPDQSQNLITSSLNVNQQVFE